MPKKKAIVSVTNDLVGDQRVHKVAMYLISRDFEVTLVGRKLNNSLPIENRLYSTHRFDLWFNKGFLFYANYNLRLFFYLLSQKFNLLVSNDLDSLAANYFAAKLKGKVNNLVYDSHEYFTQVPELVGRKRVQKVWETVEKFIVPQLKHAYTVCQSIADIYKEKYNIDFQVVRNIPIQTEIKVHTITNSPKIIIYQGAVNVGRGIENVIKAMQYVDNVLFKIIGDGDILNDLKALVQALNLNDKVVFVGKVPFEQLQQHTLTADLGISLEQNIGLNYYYALPNKLFDYIRVNIPILASDLPEIKRIVETYQIGILTNNFEPQNLAQLINVMLYDNEKRSFWKQNLQTASKELCWENEEKVLDKIYKPYLL